MTKKLILMLIVALACTLNADAQGWLGRVRDRATEAAKRTVEYNVERKTVDAVDDAMNPDRKRDNNRSKKSNDADYEDEEVEEGPQDTEGG